MTTTEPSYAARRLIADGYIDATRATEHLATVMDTGWVTTHRLAQHLNWPSMTLLRLQAGRSRLISPDLEKRLLAVDPTELPTLFPRPEPPIAAPNAVVLQRILDGRQACVDAKDKPVYARGLRAHGWGKNRIGKVLGMSGTKVNKALEGGHS
ncbi:hypothetical protein ACFRAQ_36300 [Nocardia sp. NPDC056611]|uniref:hypothetical protein n=1 Tax=Nocardia sp. NPDC056611 TaxID=3345877 RepID=UPI00366BFAAB